MDKFSKSGTRRSPQRNGSATAVTVRANSSNAVAPLLIATKPELARELRVSVRTIENMMAQRIIPFIRATKRICAFTLELPPNCFAAMF